MAYSDYDYNPADIFSPAMGRVMADDPESAIDYFVKAGISPNHFAQIADASNTIVPASPETFIPQSGDISRPEDDPYRQPEVTPGMKKGQVDPKLSADMIFGRAKDYYGNLGGKVLGALAGPEPDPNSPLNVQKLFAPKKPKADDRVPESKPGPVPPSALAKKDEDEEEPYTPSTKYATLEGGKTTALPPSDPRKGETEEVSAAKKARDKDSLGDWLSGVKAPPQPAQPVLRPFSERGGAFPTSMPIVQLLSAILSGQATGPEVLRLSQAIGK